MDQTSIVSFPTLAPPDERDDGAHLPLRLVAPDGLLQEVGFGVEYFPCRLATANSFSRLVGVGLGTLAHIVADSPHLKQVTELVRGGALLVGPP